MTWAGPEGRCERQSLLRKAIKTDMSMWCKTENPIWTLEKKWNITSVRSDFERLLTYDETGAADFRSEVNEFYDVVDRLAAKAGELLEGNLQDRTIREGFRAVGWKPEQRAKPAHAEAVEWWLYGE